LGSSGYLIRACSIRSIRDGTSSHIFVIDVVVVVAVVVVVVVVIVIVPTIPLPPPPRDEFHSSPFLSIETSMRDTNSMTAPETSMLSYDRHVNTRRRHCPICTIKVCECGSSSQACINASPDELINSEAAATASICVAPIVDTRSSLLLLPHLLLAASLAVVVVVAVGASGGSGGRWGGGGGGGESAKA
jgi:hypothetical protein